MELELCFCCCCVVVATVGFGRGLGALKSAATVTSFVFLFTVLCFLYFVTVNQFCMSDFFTRLRQLYNLLTPSLRECGGYKGGRNARGVAVLLSSCGSLGLVAAAAAQKRS